LRVWLIGLITLLTLPCLAHAGAIKAVYSSHHHIGDWIAGTDYGVDYQFGDHDSLDLRLGDRVRFHVVMLSGGEYSAPCDSFELAATLGQTELPLAVEWALLGNMWGIDLKHALSTAPAVLEGRFSDCGDDTLQSVSFQLTIAETDTTGRKQISSARKILQQAILDLRESRNHEVASRLDPLVEELGANDYFRCVYAAALVAAGRCVDFARQSSILAQRGFGEPKFSIHDHEAHCSHWQKPPYTLR
jgi:hypothetical protein